MKCRKQLQVSKANDVSSAEDNIPPAEKNISPQSQSEKNVSHTGEKNSPQKRKRSLARKKTSPATATVSNSATLPIGGLPGGKPKVIPQPVDKIVKKNNCAKCQVIYKSPEDKKLDCRYKKPEYLVRV